MSIAEENSSAALDSFAKPAAALAQAERTEEAVFTRLRPLITEVTGVPPENIRMESNFVMDLGAESIDLLDLSFLVEEAFGITIEPNEFESRVKARIAPVAYEKDGELTEAALAGPQRAGVALCAGDGGCAAGLCPENGRCGTGRVPCMAGHRRRHEFR